MKTIELQIPEGKKAEWINGVLTLVDEEVKDNRPVTDRIKTFEDACRELGDNHLLVQEYQEVEAIDIDTPDMIAYLKLRIIAAALNEGWKPQFTNDEWRYFPYFILYTKKEIDEMDEEKKSSELVLWGGGAHHGAICGLASANSNRDWSNSYASIGSRLCFKTRELAEYAGKQFIEIWMDYNYKA